jgi:uncharacterized FlaG/YvyC family protein
MKINEKYTAEQRKELKTAIMIMAMVGAGNAPETQEELDKWCDKHLATVEARKAHEAELKAKREAREATAGYKAHRNWKRHDTEIRRAREEIERLMKEIEYHEARKAEYAKAYEAETGKEIEG